MHIVKERVFNKRLRDYNRSIDSQLYVHNVLGLQKAIYDDSYGHFGTQSKVLETLSLMKSTVLEENLQGWYSLDGSRPIAVFELVLQNDGIYSKRIAFTAFDLFEKFGGVQIVVFTTAIFFSDIFSYDVNNIQLIKLFKISDCCYFNNNFKLKSICLRNFCCKNRKFFNSKF